VQVTEDPSIKLLLIGVSEFVEKLAKDLTSASEVKHIQSADDFIALLESPDLGTFNVVIAGAVLKDIQTPEIAQSLRGTLANTVILYCHDTREPGFDRQNLIKNGFNDAFLLPFDSATFRSVIEELVVKVKDLPIYRMVRVGDIDDKTVLDFDLFVLLPSNKKYLKYCKSGQAIEQNRLVRLKDQKVDSVFVPLNQMDKFYHYSANRLKALTGESCGLSETEKRQQLQEAVRGLMTDIFSTNPDVGFEDGKRMMADANGIVSSYLSQSNEGELYSRLLKTYDGSNTSYSHLSNTCTFAVLFSMATGIGKPEELGISGLFHDLGISVIPAALMAKDPREWTSEELATYERHPEHSVNLIKEKRIVLPQNIQTMILQHHERIDGTGYPLKITEPKLKLESQLLGIADEFDELTRSEIGRPTVTPEKAFANMVAGKQFSLSILEKLSYVFNGKAPE